MKLHSLYKAILLSALATLAVGCSHQQIPIKKVFSSNNCGITKPALKIIATPIELDDLFQSIPKTFSQRTLLVPEIDFEKEQVLNYEGKGRCNIWVIFTMYKGTFYVIIIY